MVCVSSINVIVHRFGYGLKIVIELLLNFVVNFGTTMSNALSSDVRKDMLHRLPATMKCIFMIECLKKQSS